MSQTEEELDHLERARGLRGRRRARRPLRAERAEGRRQEGRPGRRVGPRGRGAEDLRSRPGTSTSSTCSPRADTRARSTSTASRPCATSRRSRSTRPTPPPATASTTSRRRCSAGLTWGDVHHPSLSETNGDYDGRWLFVNDMNGRVARIDLRDFKTKQIFGPMPNVSGNHGSAFVTPNTEYSDDGLALLDPDPEGHLRADREVRHGLQGRPRRREDRPEDRRDDARLARFSRLPSTGTSATPARRSPTAGCSGPATTPSAPPASSRSRPPSATATTSPPSTGRPSRRRSPRARAT